ncbi:MAG: Gfo/Idh/MocA family oxidoreductase [Planctomycetota bacterium]
MDVVRVGILGASWIAPSAIIKPAREVPEVKVNGVAARDRRRAELFARKHGMNAVFDSYQALIDASEIDAVYNPLPNSLHCEWTIRALEAGKHVLCEKPIACNADEAQRMADAAKRSGRILMEAMHYRHHPLANRVRELLLSNAIGKPKHLELRNCFPIFRGSDIRYQYALGGGALMDLGCYSLNFARFLAGEEPEVVAAEAKRASPNVDRWMQARLQFPSGLTARVTCSLWSKDFLAGDARILGDAGEIKVINPNAPHLFHSLEWQADGIKQKERLTGLPTSYCFQLRAFANAVLRGGPIVTDANDAVANMRVIDAIYRRAGLPVRGQSLPA